MSDVFEIPRLAVDVDLAKAARSLAELPDLTEKEARAMVRSLQRSFTDAQRASEKALRAAAVAASKVSREQSREEAAIRRARERAEEVSRREQLEAEREAAREKERIAREVAREQVRQQDRATREIESSIRGQQSAIKGLSSAAIGGVAGDLFDLAEVANGASTSMAAIGIAIGGVAVAGLGLYEVVTGTIELANSAVEARDRLREQGAAIEAMISPTALAQLDSYEAATADLATAADIATAEIGAALTPALTEVSRVLIELAPRATAVASAIGSILDASQAATPYMRGFVAVISGGSSEAVLAGMAYSGLAEVSDDVANGHNAAAIAAARASDRHADLAMQLGDTLDAERRAREEAARLYAARRDAERSAKDQADAEKALAEAQREGARAAQELARMEQQAQADIALGAKTMREAEEAALAAGQAMRTMGTDIDMSPTYAQLEEINRVAGESSRNIQGMGESARSADLEDTIRNAASAFGILASATGQALGGLQQLASMEQRRHEERVRNLRDERASNRETLRTATRDFAANQGEMTALERQAAAAELAMLQQSTQAKNANIRAVEKEEERAANKAFRRMQSLKRAEAKVAAAANAVALTLAMAYLGPGAPVAGLSIAATQLGIQLAVINNTQPPKYHYGTRGQGQQAVGIPGQEYTATLERGEEVLSRRAMQVPGAREIVAALERSQRPSAMGAPALVIGDQQADAIAARANRPLSRLTRGTATAGRGRR